LIHILEAGLRSTVQDAGRLGHVRDGIPPAGPADPAAFHAANALVGNAEGAACLEIVGAPFSVRSDDPRLIAVTGRDVLLSGRGRLPAWSALFVRGSAITVRAGERTRYAYLAVSGGIASEPVLGSRAAYPLAGIGRYLRAGDALPVGPSSSPAEDAGRTRAPVAYDGRIRAIPGPHAERFAPAALERLFSGEFRIDAASDRQGARLVGPDVAPLGGELLACGMVAGAIQVPRGGAPIVLLADHQTTGGYPVIATVIEADLGKVAQANPGETLRFYRFERATA
jgi:biotin-dependent carboxylase-like uncharacterized protein